MWVFDYCFLNVMLCFLTAYVQNDEIEKLGLERSSIYRKCRLDEIRLPLVAGNLKNVPMEEVCTSALATRLYAS